MTDLVWTNIDPTTLSADAQKLFNGYKEAYRLASDRRKAFEAQVIADHKLPTATTLKFGYRFGKLSVAVAPADAPAKPERSAKLSLADYLKTVSTR